MVMAGVLPPMVEALRRVRRRRSGTPLWKCCAGRAATCIRSKALHRVLLSDVLPRIARERVSTIASAPPNQIVKRRASSPGTLPIGPGSGRNPRLPVPQTVILDSNDSALASRISSGV
jgi:hypothetical protein